MRTHLQARARAGALAACLLPVLLVSAPAPAAATASSAAQGSGTVVPLRGDAQLQVTLRGIAMPADVDGAYYDGSERPPLGRTGVVEDLYVGNLYEGVFATWIGTSAPEPFRVFRLEGPPRIVVDVAHGR